MEPNLQQVLTPTFVLGGIALQLELLRVYLAVLEVRVVVQTVVNV